MRRRPNPAVIVVILIMLVAIAGAATYFIKKHIPTDETMDLREYFGEVQSNEAILVIGDAIQEQRAILGNPEAGLTEENIYLPQYVVTEALNQRFYWDAENRQILYALPSELTSTPAQSEPGSEVWQREDSVFLSLAFVHRFTDMDVVMNTDPARVAIRNKFDNVMTVASRGNTAVRYRGGIKSPILTRVPMGEKMVLIEELEDWYYVVAKDGCVGYVRKKDTNSPEPDTEPRNFQQEDYVYNTLDTTVNLVWHQISVRDANSYLSTDTQYMGGVNVISPTWYSMIDNSGNISDISSSDYVAQAHAKGLKVWGLIDNFSTEISSFEILSHYESRQNVIRQLITSATGVGLDGINIDFELLSEESGVHFLEFLRELSIPCHKYGLTLSVDNTVPAVYTSHYDRGEQGKVVDYIIIMGYDEHYQGSEAGSVASLPWVEKGIQETIAEVPAERVINGIPFYTRLWKTLNGNVTSEAIGMKQAQDVIRDNHVQTYWDNNVYQNVGSFELGNATFQIWLEDNQSIAEKVKLIPKYGLAGVASWKLGFEDSSIWATITENLQG